MAWMIMVDGFVVDVRQMPRAIQEVAYTYCIYRRNLRGGMHVRVR